MIRSGSMEDAWVRIDWLMHCLKGKDKILFIWMWIKPWWITLKGLNRILSFRHQPARLNTCRLTMGSEANQCASDWKYCLPGFGKTDEGESSAAGSKTYTRCRIGLILLYISPLDLEAEPHTKKVILSHIMQCIIQLLSHNSIAEPFFPPLGDHI